MARNYGRTVTSIWSDPDFLMLGSDARFAYVMLFNQPKISAVGVLEVTGKRWTRALGFGAERLFAALDELAENNYIVLDDETEELFVRSFVRHDGGVNNDLRRKAIQSAAVSVVSPMLRTSIAVELDRLAVPHALSNGLLSPIEDRRVVVNKGDHLLEPLSSIQEPGAVTPVAAGDSPPSMFCEQHPNGTTEPCGACARAREVYGAAAQAKLTDDLAARTARKAAIAACGLCDPNGKRVDPTTGLVIARVCDHVAEAASFVAADFGGGLV